jgi:hypothetical protein
MAREPLLMPLPGLAKDLDHESNGWGSNKDKARFLVQFPPKPPEQLFPWLNLSAWQSPVRARITWITLLHKQQLSMPSRHCRRDQFEGMGGHRYLLTYL